MDKKTLRQRITAAQLDDLRNRRVTTRALAKELGVTEGHLSRVFPGKIPSQAKTVMQEKARLRKIRDDYRQSLAKQVVDGQLTVSQAAAQAYCHERTMFRHLKRIRNAS